ncbi:RICIN domain-containing protein [Variovorax sp. W2I14]|uniref:RICIN domain-containing protein n=1 Tax=Variovorax sp. W2I14 TaxID=3042290 RepID=UPI003D259362
MTQWFCVLTGGGVGSEQLLWADAPADLGTNDSGLNGTIVYMKYASADYTPYLVPPQSQMWQLTFDGTIVSALSPNYVLGLSGSNAVLVERVSGSASQQWEFQWVRNSDDVMLGTLRNKGNQQYLIGSGDWSWAAISTTAMPASGPTDLMLWYVRPSSPPTNQALTIRSVAATTDASAPMVVNIDGSSLDPGATTILYPMQPHSPNSIWTYTPEGFLLSAINPGLALSLNCNANVGGGSANGVATYPILPAGTGPNMQQWSFNLVDRELGTYLIVNQDGMQALAISGTSASDPLQLVTPPDVTDQNQLWTVSPTYPLEVLLAQPAAPYPAFTDEEATAYAYINTQLGLAKLKTELRSQYPNLAAPLAGYQSRIAMLATWIAAKNSPQAKDPPSGLPDTEAMLAVANLLSEELTAAQAVQQLFQQLSTFHSELAIVTTNATAAIIADAAIDTQSTQTVQISSASIIEGLMYTLVSMGSMLTEFGTAAKGVGLLMPVIANMYQTGASTVNSYRQSKAQSSQRQTDEKIFYDFEGEVADVQQFLADSFTAIGNALAATESVILGDSFKTRAVAAMTALPSGGNSLFWPPSQGLSLIPAIVPGYEVGVLQALLPTKYQIYTGTWIQGSWQSNQTGIGIPPIGAPSYCIWDDVTDSSVGASTVYWIASVASHDSGYPGQATMDFLNNRTGVRWFNFYRRLAGWNGFASGEKYLTDNQTILLFRNYTSETLSIALDANDAQIGLNGLGSTSLTLQPFGYLSAVLFSGKDVGGDHKPGASVKVTTSDGTLVWSAGTVGWDTCSAVSCPNSNFVTYPYSSSNAPVTFSSSVTTGTGGCEIGIARPASGA